MNSSFIYCITILFLISCNAGKNETKNKIDASESIKHQNGDCEKRQISMTIGCGTGCAFILDEARYKYLKNNIYKVFFNQELRIYDEEGDTESVFYFFECNNSMIIKVYDEENINLLDEEESTQSQVLSFSKYGNDICNCLQEHIK